MDGATSAFRAASSETLGQLLATRAEELAEHRIFTFLDHQGGEAGRLSFGELDRRARELAGTLQGLTLAGERVLMVSPPGPGCVVALYGCIYAGAVAVPCPPPDPGRKHAGPRLRAILADSTPRAVLSPAALQRGFLMSNGGDDKLLPGAGEGPPARQRRRRQINTADGDSSPTARWFG